MTFYDLEKYYRLLVAAERLKAEISSTGGLRAVQYDSVHTSGGGHSDKTCEAAVRRSELTEKLKRVERLNNAQRPEVEAVIEAAMKVVPVKKRLITGLVFRMRYCEGRDWFDIEAVTGIKNARQTVISTLEKMTGG